MYRIHLIVWIINILQRAYNYVHPGEFVEILCEYEKRYKWLTTIRFKRHDSPTWIWPCSLGKELLQDNNRRTSNTMIHQIVSKKKKKSYSFYFYLRTNSTSSTRARLLLHSPFLLRSKTRHNQFHNDSSVVLNHTLDLHSRLKKSRCFNIISLFLVLNVSFSLAFN